MRDRFVPIGGTLVMADITGFTPLSERLAARGKEGAELLTQIINAYFQRLLDAALPYGGDNLKFGGDALLLLFRGEDHADRAISAALAMQRENRRGGAIRVADERARLQMRVSAHSDTFWSAIVGIPGERLQQVIAGPGIVGLAHVDKLGAPGEIALSPETLREARFASTLLRDEEVVVAIDSHWRMPRSNPVLPPAEHPDELARWGIATAVEGEHRKVVVMFARLDGLNELIAAARTREAFEALDKFVRAMVAAVAQFGGYLAGNDVDQSGVKFIILLGAPVANEQAAANALRLALALQAAGRALGTELQLRIGINSGYTFCGDVGADHRREYTVLGDAVNLSARLMSRAAESQILVSETTAEEAGPTFSWRQLEPMTIKGKAHPVRVRGLESERRQFVPRGEAVRFIGRASELGRIRELALECEHASGRILAIEGDPGSGKSRLVTEATGEMERDGWKVLRGAALSFTAGIPFSAWSGVVSSLLGITDTHDTGTRTTLATEAIAALDVTLLESASLLNPILSLSLPESEALRSLDAENRRRRLYDLFAQLLIASSRLRPTVVVLEDLHWADSSTHEVLESVSSRVSTARVLVCVTSRNTIALPVPDAVIRLRELHPIEARSLFDAIIARENIDEQVARSIVERCQGNPLFIEEVGRALTLEGLNTRGGDVLLPDRLQSLLMLRLDALARPARRVARLAAVVGAECDEELLSALLEPEDRPFLENALEELLHSEILVADAVSHRFRFRHSLQQEVAYESLLFARRRELHAGVMGLLHERQGDDVAPIVEILAYHARLADKASETVRFSFLAGQKSQRLYAWESAVTYYETARTEVGRLGKGSASPRSLLLERIGDCREVVGRSSEAARSYISSLEAWNRVSPSQGLPPALPPEIPPDGDEAGRSTRLRLKIAVSFERHAQYDRSMRWLRTAATSMPPRRSDLRAALYSSWSVALFRKGQFQEATEWAKKALTAANRTGQPERIAYSHHVLANALGETGRLRNSVWHREAALQLYEQIGDLPRLMAGHGNLGISYQALGEFPLAIEHHEECIKAADQIGNSYAVAIGNLNLGEVILSQGHFDEAAARFESTIAIFRATGEARVPAGLALINLSRARLKQGEIDAAARCQQEGMELLGADSRGLAAEGTLQAAEIEFARGRLKEAATTCRRVLVESRELGAPLLEAKALLLESRLHGAFGRHSEAEECGRQSLATVRRVGASYETALALLNLAQISSSRRRHSYAESAAALFARIGAEADAATAHALANS